MIGKISVLNASDFIPSLKNLRDNKMVKHVARNVLNKAYPTVSLSGRSHPAGPFNASTPFFLILSRRQPKVAQMCQCLVL
jgi:hypothetical protein